MAAQSNPSISLASRLTAVSTKLLGQVFRCWVMRSAYRAGCECAELNLLHSMRVSVIRHVKSRRVSSAFSTRCSRLLRNTDPFAYGGPARLSLFRGIPDSSNDRRGNLLHAPESPHGGLSTVAAEQASRNCGHPLVLSASCRPSRAVRKFMPLAIGAIPAWVAPFDNQ